jgi:hypothetical protein
MKTTTIFRSKWSGWSEGYGRREETIAIAADSFSAKAVFEAAVKRRPGEHIMVRQKARVIDDS